VFDSSLQRIRKITAMAERQQELAARVARLTPFDGTHQTALPSLALTCASVPTLCIPTVYQPCLAIVVQGRKRALLKDDVFHYDALNYLVVSVTLPGMGQVLEATPEHPYLSLRLNLDLEEIARLVLELVTAGPPPPRPIAAYSSPAWTSLCLTRYEDGEAARYAGRPRRARVRATA